MKTITLTDGTVTKVSNEDYDFLSRFTWSNNKYPITTLYYSQDRTGERECVTMHRLIMGCGLNNMEVDHINRDKMDNIRENLRVVTKSQNRMNSARKHKKFFTCRRQFKRKDGKIKISYRSFVRIGIKKYLLIAQHKDEETAFLAAEVAYKFISSYQNTQ